MINKINIVITRKPFCSKERAMRRVDKIFKNLALIEKLKNIFIFMSPEYINRLSYVSFIGTMMNLGKFITITSVGDLIIDNNIVILSETYGLSKYKVKIGGGKIVGHFYAKEVCRILETGDPDRYIYSEERDFSIGRLKDLFEGELFMVEADTEMTARRVFNRIIYNQPAWINDLWIIRSGSAVDVFFKSYRLSVSIWVNEDNIYYREDIEVASTILCPAIMEYKISGIKELEERIEKRRDSL